MVEDAGELAQRLLSVIDNSLSMLSTDELLGALLDRVREVLPADTAAILLRERGGTDLVATVARGLEEEVYAGVRIPLGTGFAGTIGARREAVLLTEVTSATVRNPILWQTGIRVLLGVPLLDGEDLLGVLHVGRLNKDPFTPDDVSVLQVTAARVASTLSARLDAEDVIAARLLERGLRPTALPHVAGLEFAARYLPADGRNIGGDWYDCFTTPSGQHWMVTGDVAGHGIHAAIVMGRIKSSLRSYALLTDDPAEVLSRTGAKILHFEAGAMATVICAVTAPPFDTVRISSAGHPPPVVATPDGATTFAPVVPGPPLGFRTSSQPTVCDLPFPAGTLLALYTDGLIERRAEGIDEGLLRLRQLVSAGDPEQVCQHIIAGLLSGEPLQDDAALVVMRRTPDSAGS